jgi:hypothetical protein
MLEQSIIRIYTDKIREHASGSVIKNSYQLR